jgi:hypothetical protein
VGGGGAGVAYVGPEIGPKHLPVHRKKKTGLQRISIDVFPEKELSGLSSDFHIDVSVSGQ